MKVVFRTDGGGGGYGLGHLTRCISIAEAFREKNIECLFICRNYAPGISLVQEHRFELFIVPSQCKPEEDTHHVCKLISNADIIIVDGYHFSSQFLSELNSRDQFVVYVDDLIDRDLPVDAVLGNVYASRSDYGNKLSPTTLLLSGPEHIPLRRMFQKLPPQKISHDINHILLTFGGEDPSNVTLQVSKALFTYPKPITIHILVGAAYSHDSDLEEALAQCPHPYKIHRNVLDVLSVFQHTDVAITAASTTQWELAAVGVPMIIIQTAANQCRNALYAQQNNLGKVLGWYKSINDKQIQDALTELTNKQVRTEYSQRCQALVDGNGPQRIVEALLLEYRDQIIEFRKTDPDPSSADSQLLWQWRNDPVTRQMSRVTGLATWEGHKKWYGEIMLDPTKVILIAYQHEVPVGTIRFYFVDKECAEIYINIAPEKRGRGLGKTVLKAACRYGFDNLGLKCIDGAIKPENTASIRVFEDSGFEFLGLQNDLYLYQRKA